MIRGFIHLSNVYAEEGKWDERSIMKTKMRNLAAIKVWLYSMIEIDHYS